jgi:hypothetical protein
MKTKLVPLGLLIPAAVLAQPMPPALPEVMTQNQIRLIQRASSYTTTPKDSKSLKSDSCDSTCQAEAEKAYKENMAACEEAGGTYSACYDALNGYSYTYK